jgi:hypothetical protein
MIKSSKKYRCPLCGSLLDQSRYYEIVGIWEARQKLEKTLRDQLKKLQEEKQKLIREKRDIKNQMKKQIEKAQKEAFEKGIQKEKERADRLSKMIEAKTKDIQKLNNKIKELQEQLKKGTTPQIEGLNLEEELVKELRKEFPEDIIEHHGKTGDILHRIYFKNNNIGLILYECKKTTKFSSDFIDQTKKAMAQRKASYGVLVTTAFKEGTAGFWVEKDILVVHPYGAIYIAKVLRKSIIEIHSLKLNRTEIEKRSKELMEYIKSDDFKNSVEDSIYRTRILYDILKKEIKNHQKIWQDRYLNYKFIHDNITKLELITSNILKGFTQKEAIEHLKLKQLPPLED